MNKMYLRLSFYSFIPLLFISASLKADIDPYIGLSVGESSSDAVCVGCEGWYDDCSCEGVATSHAIFIGARLNTNLAIEASYIDMGQFTKSTDTSWVTAESKGANFSLIGILTVENISAEVFGKIGLLYWDTKLTSSELITGPINDNGADVSLGIGASIGNKKYALRLEYEMLNELSNEYKSGGSIITVGSIAGVIYF